MSALPSRARGRMKVLGKTNLCSARPFRENSNERNVVDAMLKWQPAPLQDEPVSPRVEQLN